MSNKTKSIKLVLTDVTFNFPRLGTPWRPEFEGNKDHAQWSTRVEGLSSAALAKLKDAGAPVKTTDSGEPCLNFKAYTVDSYGNPSDFKVYSIENGKLVEMPKELRDTIGQGSTGHIRGYMYQNDYDTWSFRMTAVAIDNLVERADANSVEQLEADFGL